MNRLKESLMIVLALFLVLPLISLAGCTSGESSSNGDTTYNGDTLDKILGRAQNTVTMKYDMVVTMPGFSVITTTTWVKKNKMRMEMSMQEIATVLLTDQDAKTMYSYMPAQNIAMKVNYDQAQKPATQEAGSIADYNPKNLGTESIDGKTCLVVEYSAEQATTKMWIWEDRGLPVKVEKTSTEGKTIIDYKNYDFSDIPDSMFELPSGVQIIQTGGEGIKTPTETTSPATTTPTTTDTSKSTKTTSGETLTGKIAFVSSIDGSLEIYTMNPDGSNQQRITSHTGGGWTDNDRDPVWSPNADKIIFTSWRDGLNELFIVNSDGTGEARLTSLETSWNDFPSWSPDGSRIAFVSYRTGHAQIYIMNADGSNQTRLTYAKDSRVGDTLSFVNPSWSPDGSRILGETHWFSSGGDLGDDAGGIYVFSVNTGDYTQLTHSSNDHNAVWSPDSSKIAFWRSPVPNDGSRDEGDIYVMNSNGSGLTRLTGGHNPVWSPVGSKIAFISAKTGDDSKLYVIQSDGSGEINLIGTRESIQPFPSWSPDGEKLVWESLGEIYLVNSDGSGLKKITTGAQGGLARWSLK